LADLPNARAVYFPYPREWRLSIVDAQEREMAIATLSGPTNSVEMRKITQLASMYEWQ
jgi:hypothetical protein